MNEYSKNNNKIEELDILIDSIKNKDVNNIIDLKKFNTKICINSGFVKNENKINTHNDIEDFMVKMLNYLSEKDELINKSMLLNCTTKTYTSKNTYLLKKKHIK
jgi:hypothetical protein